MSVFRTTKEDREQLARDNLAFGDQLVETPVDPVALRAAGGKAKAVGVWRSRRFLVVLWIEPNTARRLTCQRTKIRPDGQWEDGITWDDLQRLKTEAGFGDAWAVEAYPPSADVVNVANMRHLWLLDAPPHYGWKAKP